MIKDVFDMKGGLILGLLFLVLVFMQYRFQLRETRTSFVKHGLMNFLVAIPSFVLLRLLFIPAMVFIALQNQHYKIGLNDLLWDNIYLQWILAFLVMDYTNYLWHKLNHKLPLLWRFHLVHHIDRHLDVTTALRFHFFELIGSVFFRGFFVLLSGASPLQILVYEIVFESATQFHHSNWRIPVRIENIINKVFVTPRMHGIHHSEIKAETDSNYSVVFSFWDRLHRTLRLNVAQKEIVIGVPSYPDEREQTLFFLLKLPFSRIRKWSKDKEIRGGG